MSDQYPILPSEKYLAQLLGITDEQYADFRAQARQRARENPSLVVAGIDPVTWSIISAVLTVISIGLTIVASFFKPKPGRPASIEGVDKSQDAINSVERYAPRVGFDAVQEIARIGQVIPLVFTRRETVNGEIVGGIRVTCPLIWSQIQSYGGNQLLRSLFLISEGEITSIDPNNFAIGSNVIGSYLLSEAGSESRLSVYLKKGGANRIKNTDLIAGRPAVDDPGAESTGDIFTVNGEPNFCSVSKPTTQTTFGLYAPIGNNLGFRVNPVFRPGVNPNLVPKGKKGDATVKCTKDSVSLSQRAKYKAFFSTRSGLISGNVSSVGATVEYKLFKSSDKETEFSIDLTGAAWSVEKDIETDGNEALKYFFNYSSSYSGSNISATTAKSFLSVGALTTDVEERKVSYTVTFNLFAAQPYLADKRNGVYTLSYILRLKNSSDEDNEIDIQEDWDITAEVERAISYTWSGTINTTDADWQYNSTTDTLTKVTAGSATADGTVTVQTGEATVTFDGGPSTSINLTAGTITRSFVTSYQEADLHEEKAGDVASTVASKQRGWDDAIVRGELYKVGSALCVCSSRTDDVFQSEAEFEEVAGGKNVEATFKTIRPGQVTTYSPALLQRAGDEPTEDGDRKTATDGPHIHRIAIGEIGTSRACERVEIGIKSVLGIRIGGLCNFKDTLSFTEVDSKACNSKKDSTVKKGDVLKVDQYQSGFITCSSDRFSFFRISYREAGTAGGFIDLGATFGVRGITQQNQFNGIAFNMPGRKRWTFRFEPISGWEIRNNIVSGQLYILNSKLEEASLISVGIASFRGQLIPRTAEEFWITVGRRTDAIGIPHRDVENHIDHYGKLAEQFIYEEVSASTQSPEHEIVYINEIVSNATTPTYEDLAVLGLNIRSSTEWQQFSQFSCYVTGGIDNTHLFPEILKKLLLDNRYGLGHAISPSQIDDASFAAASSWCSSRGYYFDGVISERQNIRQWAADVAATMLLIFGEANGKFFLRPALSFTSVEIKGMFTADNVLEKTYQMQYFDSEDRQPIQVSIKYREERDSDNPTSPGLFPTERELLIRESSSSETERIEPIDVSDYVTSRAHAIDIAKFIIRMRRLPTHGIKFQTTYDGLTANLAPGDYIRCAIDSTYYDDFNNGVVSATGALTSTQALANGTYQVFAWDGSGDTTPDEITLTVSGGGTTATPTGIIFSVQNITTSIRTYQIESLGIEENGAITIEAVHMPTDQMVANWDSAGSWDIQE